MKKIFYISVLLCMVFWLKIPSQAAEKELSVDIPHDAGIATFFLDFVTDQEYINQICDYTEDAEHDDAPDSAASCLRLLWRG